MKSFTSSLTRRAEFPHFGAAGYRITAGGALEILDQEGRAPTAEAWVSPAVLGEIDRYIHLLEVA